MKRKKEGANSDYNTIAIIYISFMTFPINFYHLNINMPISV